jgi:hypothetical protein
VNVNRFCDDSYLEFVISVTLVTDETFRTLLHDLGFRKWLDKDHFGILIYLSLDIIIIVNRIEY